MKIASVQAETARCCSTVPVVLQQLTIYEPPLKAGRHLGQRASDLCLLLCLHRGGAAVVDIHTSNVDHDCPRSLLTLQEMPAQHGNVVKTLSQRRHFDRVNTESLV